MREATEGGHSAVAIQQSEWEWRTFPVFFAFAMGGFLSLIAGIVGGPLGLTVVFALFGGMVGFGVSRIGSRELVKRGIIKPRPRQRRR